MPNGWSAQNYAQSTPILGIVTNRVVSKEYPITSDGALHCVIKIVASGVTVVGSITAKLQTAIGADWVDSKTVAIAANGNVYIKLLAEAAADQTYLPLLNKGRIVITTTNASDAVSVDEVDLLQEL
jgi:hypothetical protein